MHILLAYSTRHYTPEGGGDERLAASSAATLARTLYAELSRYGEVEYVDGVKPPKRLSRQHYDMLVGIQGSLTPLSRLARFDKVVLFAVNMHPAERNRILHAFNRQYGVCAPKHVARNSVHLRQVSDIEKADVVMLVGNATIARSFLTQGTPLHSLRRFNYTSALPLRAVADLAPGRTPRVLYVATEMCLRKGFDVLADILQQVQDVPFVCGIVGGSGDAGYQEKLALLQKQLGDRLIVHGWVNSSSPEYVKLLREYDVVVFPSLEEGQAGSVLDAMSQGLVPLITRQTGVDYAPLGYLEPAMGCADNGAKLRSVLEASPAQRLAWQQETLAWYRLHHDDWVSNVSRALALVVRSGKPWPTWYGEQAPYVLDAPGGMPELLAYDMVDKLEQAPGLAAVAVCNVQTAAPQRLRWVPAAVPPAGAIVMRRRGADGPCLVAVPDANGADTLAAPLPPQPIAGWWARVVVAPFMGLLGWIHPDKQQRKLYYNRWRMLRRR